MDKLFDRIRKDREGVVNSSVYPGIKKLVSQIYPDKAHFIYELLQNAEDTGASAVNFIVKENMLVFEHNGKKQFDINDINAITNIGDSTKKNNYVQAGKFGIGFKSVYAFTDTPSIFCDTICFKIENLLLPTKINDIVGRKEGWTVFHFPYDSPKIVAQEARLKIIEGLKEIEETTPLFLNNINKICYSINDDVDDIFYEINKTSKPLNLNSKDGIIVTSTVTKSGKVMKNMKWLKFSDISELNEKTISVDIAYPFVISKKGQCQITSGTDKVCITFLAKNEKSNLKFYINAPFGCTPARDSINKNDDDNEILINKIAELVNKSLFIIKANGLLDDSFLEVLPLKEDSVPCFYLPIVEMIDNAFKHNDLLPTMSGKNIHVEDGIMASKNVADTVLDISDVRILYKNDKLEFVQTRPLNSRAYKFLKKLNIEELVPDSVIYKMTRKLPPDFADWINRFDNVRLANLYGFLSKGIIDLKQEEERYREFSGYSSYLYSKNESTIGKYEKAKHYENIKKILSDVYDLKIVKDDKDIFYRPADVKMPEDGVKIPEKYKRINPELIKSATSKSFLQEIGVTVFTNVEYNKYIKNEEKKDCIRKLKSVNSTNNPIEIAKLIMYVSEKYSKYELEEDINTFKCVKVKSGDQEYFVTVSECYLDVPYVSENGFGETERIHMKKRISDIYQQQMNKDELEKWIKYLKDHGAYYRLMVDFYNESTGYKTGYNIDYNIENLEKYLQVHNFFINKYLWDMFTNYSGWKREYEFSRYLVNKNYQEEINESSLLKALKVNSWVMDNKGEFKKPSMISRDNISPNWSLKYDNGFLKAIGLGSELKRIEEEKRIKEKSVGDAAKLLGFSSASDASKARDVFEWFKQLQEDGIDVYKLVKSSEKNKILKELPSNVDDMIKAANKKATSGNYDYEEDDEISPVKNPKRRAEKITQTITEENNNIKNKSIVERETRNPMEKEFVGSEYRGICQICSKKIVKRNNERYFEAVNMFPTNKVDSKYNVGNSTGWNTLCLCPNCSAEYRYGVVELPNFEKNVLEIVIDKESDDYFEFEIIMQSQRRKLKYTPRHLFSLQTALKHFRNQENIQSKITYEDESLNNNYKTDEKGIYLVHKENKCPKCEKIVSDVSYVEVKDKNGIIKYVPGHICQCGCEFITRNQEKKLEEKNLIKKVVEKNTDSLVKVKTASNRNVSKCSRCGIFKDMFADKSMCWECYKYERQSEFD